MALGLLCAEYDSNVSEHDTERWKSVLREVCRRINDSTFYTGVSVEEEELSQNIMPRDIGSLYLYAYYKGMVQYGADRLMIKEHQSWRIAPFFLKKFPKSKLIVQVRDPRDNVASCKKLANLYIVYHGSITRAARMWTKDQLGALQLLKIFGEGVVRIHRYEDLVLDPRKTLQGVCEFLGLEWQESMLQYYHAQAEQRKRSEKYLYNMWANLDQPVKSNSVNQWKENLKTYELRSVERECGLLLTEFGYVPSWPDKISLGGSIFHTMYQLYETIRYLIITAFIWLAWLVRTHDYSVPFNVVLGNTVRAHLPYERFRDRLGYRL
jgi:hypothetical protein